MIDTKMKKTVAMSFIATTGMTLASYLISVLKNEKFLPALILNQLIYPKKQPGKAHKIEGYLLYWLIGLGFSSVYKPIWDKSLFRPSATSGLILGFLNGIKGIAGWHLMLKTHPTPPPIKFKPFYLQLLAAHILFGYLNQMIIKKNTRKA